MNVPAGGGYSYSPPSVLTDPSITRSTIKLAGVRSPRQLMFTRRLSDSSGYRIPVHVPRPCSRIRTVSLAALHHRTVEHYATARAVQYSLIARRASHMETPHARRFKELGANW